MTVAAVGAKPAVIVNYAAVNFGIDFTFPATDGLTAIVDNQVDVFAVLSAMHVKAAPGFFQVLWV
jgi:hypothetical protein